MRGVTKISLLSLDVDKCKREIERSLTETLKEAVRAYLKSILYNVVPVWSGASVATFIKLAASVDHVVNISPKVRSRINLGSTSSTGTLNVDMNRGVISATYSTSLPHLVFNEYSNANAYGYRLRNPGPYGFQIKGADAFSSVASQARLPNPFKYLK